MHVARSPSDVPASGTYTNLENHLHLIKPRDDRQACKIRLDPHTGFPSTEQLPPHLSPECTEELELELELEDDGEPCPSSSSRLLRHHC